MNKVVLISGGARGIGAAIARELAKANYDLVINYKSSEKEAKELVSVLTNEFNVKAVAIKADISTEDGCNFLMSEIKKTFVGVDILINNAAIENPSLFNEKNITKFKEVLDTNVVGAFNLAHKVYKYMLDKKWGRIINISSTNGINTYYPMNLEYDASKAALISLTHNLSMQLAPYITVNAIAPGFIGTEKELEGYDPEFLKDECEKIFVKRYGDPKEVAYLVKFLISDEASYINNAVIRIDGGQYGS